MKNLKDWWDKISRNKDGSRNRPFVLVMAYAAVVIIVMIIMSLTGCPSKTMKALKAKGSEKIEKADEKLSRRIEKI